MKIKNNEIVLVDLYDNEIGVDEKLEIHRKNKLYRMFSIFL